MEWYESFKPYLAVSLIAPAIAMVFIMMMNGSLLGYIYPAVTLFVCFPIIMMCVYFWITGRGKKFVNGFDWSKYSDEEAKRIISFIGFWMLISMTVMIYGMSLMFVKLWIGLSLLAVSVALMVAVFIVSFTKKKIEKPLPTMDSIRAFSIILLVTAASIVPTTVFLSDGITSESVDVTLDETSFTVKAPMFDHTFSYSEIDDIQYFDDFDKGTRKMGYNDGRISSGKYNNSMFGDYQLASYSSVRPCIAISVGGDMYAFNQDSDAKTLELYNSLVSRIP